MRFSTNLKKCLSGLMLGGAALWFAGCGETSSTPSKPSSGSASPAVNGGGSIKSGDTAGAKSGSSSAGADKPGAEDEQAGSSTGGREVPEAAPPGDEDEAK
ncbi:MAG: hypothetical protein ACM3U2_20230 [Deltaproteobacteria bacterium]